MARVDDEIVVPDIAPIEIIDGEQRVDPEIERLLRIREEGGDEMLTDEEYSMLASYERAFVPEVKGHFENLATQLDEQTLAMLAKDVLEWVQWDEDSRTDWLEQEKKGLRLLGVSPNVDGGADFKGASKAVHPVLGEACVQFQARALEVLWPAGGPVKTAVLGEETDEVREQAERVRGFMNYQYTELIPGAFRQTDKLLLRLPLSGSMFTKAYFDPIEGVTRRLVEPEDFIVPYRETDLRSASRYTERVLMSRNEVKKRQVNGLYLNVELMEPREDTHEENRDIIVDEIRATEGRSENVAVLGDDDRHTLYECYAELDLPGFEDRDKDGQVTGIALPYLVVVDKDSLKVLGVYRNWKPRDETKRKLICHTHYWFIPGYGFYGWGFFHWIGSLSRAASGALRALLDSAQFANMQGGYRSKDANIENGDVPIAPGEWREADVDMDDLRKGFYALPYREPSGVLFNLMGKLEELSQRFAGTTEALVGEGSQNTPVGTILARIEQGGKVVTAIQKRLMESCREEFKIMAWLNSIYMQDEYPYRIVGQDNIVLRRDFDDRIDVLPVSDPNFVSNAQRYFVSQAVYDLARDNPGLFDMRKVCERVLQALRVDDVESVLPSQEAEIPRMGPVQEISQALMGKPIQAYMEQHHEAHIAVHRQFLATAPRDQQEMVGPILTAHIQEHYAMAFLIQMSQATGIQLDGFMQEMPVEVENQIAVRAAEVMSQMPVAPDGPDEDGMKIEADIRRKDAVAEADIRRKDAQAMADMERKMALGKTDIALKSENSLAKRIRENEEQVADLQQRNLQ